MSGRKKSRYIPKHVRDAVRERDGDRCRICGRYSEYMEFDHITPYSTGAPPTVDNIQQLCRKCNLAKRNKTDSCPNCGKWRPHDAVFCHSCGKQFNQSLSNKELQTTADDFNLRRLLRKAIGILLILLGLYYGLQPLAHC